MDIVGVKLIFLRFIYCKLPYKHIFFLRFPVIDFLLVGIHVALVGQLHLSRQKLPFLGAQFFINKGKNWVVVPKAHRQMVLAELKGYQNFLTLLQIKDHQLLSQLNLFENTPAVPNALETFRAHNQIQFFSDFLPGLFFVFVPELVLRILLLENLGFFVQITENIKAGVFFQ